jgi:DNA invertase Pin-like site-specific DNA recombinase
MNAVIYCRKSTDDDRTAADGKSTARQEELSREFADRQGWRVVGVYKDEGVSGAEFVKRPGFNEMLAAAKRKPKPFDVVVIMALSRFGRDQVPVTDALTKLHEAKVRVYCYQTGQEVKMGSPTEILVTSVEAFADAAYRHAISLSTREGLRQRAKKGYAVAQAPYAYNIIRDGEHAIHEKVDEEVPRAVKVFELAAEGWGNKTVARKMNAAKIPGWHGKPWSRELVRKILANRIYKGELVYGKYKTVKAGGSTTGREVVPEHEWIVVKAPHLRIVSDKLWDKARAVKDKATRKFGTKTIPTNLGIGSEHMLNGLARCGPCDGTMSIQVTKDTGRYYCNKHKRGLGCKNSRGVPADLLEDFVRQALHDKLNDERYIFELMELTNKRAEKWNRDHTLDANERVNLEREKRKLEGMVERLIDAVEAGQSVGGRLDQRKAQLAEVAAKLVATPVRKIKKATFFEQLEARAIGPLSTGTPAQVRDCLMTLGIQRIVVTPLPKGGWFIEGIGDPGRIPPAIAGGSGGPQFPDVSAGPPPSLPQDCAGKPALERAHRLHS